MTQSKTLTIKKEIIFEIAKFTALVSVASFAPFLKNQAVTGSIVNATLFVAVMVLGSQNAILVGLVPSLVALSLGLLPSILAPAVPFIMVSNAILILSFNYLQNKNFWLGIFSASILKFLFLFSTSTVVINLLLKKEIAKSIVVMLSWPQLATALAGGLLAYLFLKIIKKI